MILKDLIYLLYKPLIFCIYDNFSYIELSYRSFLINNNDNSFYYKSMIFSYVRLMKTREYV